MGWFWDAFKITRKLQCAIHFFHKITLIHKVPFNKMNNGQCMIKTSHTCHYFYFRDFNFRLPCSEDIDLISKRCQLIKLQVDLNVVFKLAILFK